MTIIKYLRSILFLTFVSLSATNLLASQPWRYDSQGGTITSPDGKWQFRVRLSATTYHEGCFLYLSHGDLWAYEPVLIKGRGALTVPTWAIDSKGRVYRIDSPFLSYWNCNRQVFDPSVTNITKLVIPKDFGLADKAVFYGINIASPTLLEYEVEAGHHYLWSEDGVLYGIRHWEPSRVVLMAFPGGRRGTFQIPDGVDEIERDAFHCTSLDKLIIGPHFSVSPDWMDDGFPYSFGFPVAYHSELRDKPLEIIVRDNDSFFIQDGNLFLANSEKYNDGKCVELMGSSGLRANQDAYVVKEHQTVMEAIYHHPSRHYIIEGKERVWNDRGYFWGGSVTLDYSAVEKLIINDSSLEFGPVPSTTNMQHFMAILPKEVEIDISYHPEDPADKYCHRISSSYGWNDDIPNMNATVDIYWPTEKSFNQTGLCRDCFSLGWGINVVATLHIGKDAGLWPPYVGCLKVVKDGGIPPEEEVPTPATKRLVEAEATYGKVLGTGVYTSGKQVSLWALPDAGYVFSGWELEGVAFPEGRDERDPNLIFTMGDDPVTVIAHFIPVEEDFVEIELLVGAFQAEYIRGKAMAPVTLSVASGSLPQLTVTGLPDGMRFTPVPITIGNQFYPANSIYGTLTRSGSYTIVATATTASGLTDSRRWTVGVRGEKERFVTVSCDTSLGKVSGGGSYTEGKRITLKATPLNGSVFAGWEITGLDIPSSGLNLRAASLALSVGKQNITAHAKFISKAEDGVINLLIGEKVVDNTNGLLPCFRADKELSVVIESYSQPRCSFSGLPSGLRYNTKTGTITGTARKPGLYTVKARLTNATVKKAIEKRFQLEVPHFTAANDYFVGGLANAPGEKYTGFVGISLTDGPDLRCESGKTVRVSGLPSGLKYDASKGVLTGKPTRAGAYTVTVRVGQDTSTFTIEILPLPEWLVGTFNGYGVMLETLTTSSDVEAHLDHRVGETSPRVMTVTIASSGRVKIEESYSTFSRAKITTRRQNLSGLSQVEVGTDGQLTFRLETEEATYHFKQEALEEGRAVEVGGADGCHYRLYANQWSKGEPRAPLAALIKGKKFTAEVNSDQLKRVAVTFSSNASATVKCTTPDGRTQTARGVVVCEDAEAEIYTLNVVMPNKLFVRGVLKFDELGHVVESSWWGYQPQAEE